MESIDISTQGKPVSNLPRRQRTGKMWQVVFMASTLVGIITLIALLASVINQSFGYVALENNVDPDSLAVNGVPLHELPKEELLRILKENISAGLFRRYETEKPFQEREAEEILLLIEEKVIEPEIIDTWLLNESILNAQSIRTQLAETNPKAELVFRSWVNSNMLRNPQSSQPLSAGVRTAILGSLWTIAVTILFAFPIGVGAAIYLEEYASENLVNGIIRTNINNLAGVPSIIYGMLGLAIFVRTLEPLTSGVALGFSAPGTANGRTILSAGLTLGLLILPLLIINAQESIRAVPISIRQASYGLGATRWQTVWHHVLPNAMPGILTGTILSISRAIGETAPLVVVGAATFISFDPDGLFSKFTTLPIQIYQWTARPQAEFRHLAAGAILILLLLLLSLNATAILMRNRLQKKI